MNNDYKITVELTGDDLKNIDVEQVKNEIAREIVAEQQLLGDSNSSGGAHSKSEHSKSSHSRSALQ